MCARTTGSCLHVRPELGAVSVVPLRGGHGEGTVAPATRMDSGVRKGSADTKSSAPSRLLTLDEVATACAVSVWTVRAWVDAGKLLVLRLPGRLVRVRPADLDAFLERCR